MEPMTTLEERRLEELRQRYLAHQIETATPSQRLLMLQGQLLQDLDAADEAFATMAIEPIHRNLIHAQEIVLVLRDSLIGSDWRGAEALQSVYTFVHQRLVSCNLTKDRSLLPECRNLVEQIYDANTKAAAVLPGVPSGSSGGGPGVA